jgi:hypothetical protein
MSEWVSTLGIVDRPSGIEKAREAREWLRDAAMNAFGREQQWFAAVMLLSGLVTRAFGLHDAAVAALEADNPFAAFTLIRSYAENAAAVLYTTDHPHQVERIIGLDGYPLQVGKITAYADQSQRFGGFKTVYSDLSQYAHPFAKSITASMSVEGNTFRWSSTPAFTPGGNDFVTACGWIVEMAQANAHLFVEFANAQDW